MPDRADFETKVKVARVLVDGGSMRQAAAAAGINVSTVSRYVANEEPDFMAAVDAVREYDEQHPPEAETDFPNLYAGARGISFGVVGPDFNTLIREAAGRA